MIYINNLTELPTNCKTCQFRGETNWVCNFVEWDCNISIYLQNINISEKEWHEENWKHPDCPLKKIK